MSHSSNPRDAKERVLERITLGVALATLAGYIALAVVLLRPPKK